MYKSVFTFAHPFQVVEGEGVPSDSNFLEQIGKLAPSTLARIAEETMFELTGFLNFRVSAKFLVNFPADDVLVSKHVSYIILIDGHSRLVSILHGTFSVSVVILDVKEFFLRPL